MTWTQPIQFEDGYPLTAPQLNTFLRDNMMETAPALAHFTNYWFVSDGQRRIAARKIAYDTVNTEETTDSEEFTDLDTAGPSVSLTTGTSAIVILTAESQNNTTSDLVYMGVQIVPEVTDEEESDSTGREAERENALGHFSGSSARRSYSHVQIVTGLTPGTNTFSCKYATDGGTGAFKDRRIIVLGL